MNGRPLHRWWQRRAAGPRTCLGKLVIASAAFVGMTLGRAADLGPPNGLGLRVARGFVVTQFAGPELADDIYCLTINPRGEVVVSGRGYVRTLIDVNHDGIADRAVDFGETTTGGMGLCFDGDDLWFVGDGALWRVRDADGDNHADGPAARVLDLPFSEHGGHAVRRGPDGGIYIMVGNETRLPGVYGPVGPLGGSKIDAGALLHLPAGAPAGSVRVVAHGFRNAYDFDFNWEGDIFTDDSDAEADALLPWYVPTRLYHVAPGGHHGWLLDGWKRSWPRPDYSPDTVEILAPLGRGSPTGVVCYRHRQFPEYYQEGLFALDWTFGRVQFASLEADGASYSTAPEVFLEPAGAAGFAPTDAAVSWDGALYISAGGRRSRGAVYRVDYVGEPGRANLATNWMFLAASEVLAVLDAPQPLEEWSRRLWLATARRLGSSAFVLAATDRRVSVPRRVRAIELLTETSDAAFAPNVATALARAEAPEVRARLAWSLGVRPSVNAGLLLGELANDNVAAVRVAALFALREQSPNLVAAVLEQAILANVDHADRRVRQTASLLATWLPAEGWDALVAGVPGIRGAARLPLIQATLERGRPDSVDRRAIDWTLGALAGIGTVEGRLEAVRLLQRAMGGENLERPSVEVFAGYEPAYTPDPTFAGRMELAAASLFPSGAPDLDRELARTLAMVRAANPAIASRVLAAIGPATDAASDFHYLATLARLGGNVSTDAMDRLALAIVGLDRKLLGQGLRSKQNWGARASELVQALLQRYPMLAPALVRQPELVRPGNLWLATLLGPARREACARLYRAAIQRTVGYPWTVELVNLLSALPPADVHPLFRRQLGQPTVRDRLILELAAAPRPEERPYYAASLASMDPRVAQAAAEALTRLPRDPSSLVPALRALRRLLGPAESRETRGKLLELLGHLTGEKFSARPGELDPIAAHAHIFAWVNQHYPGVLNQVDADDGESQAKWDQVLQNVVWSKGDAGRGQVVFENRGCAACHVGTSPLGPDLAGVAARLSTRDLFHAILYPSREIAPAWRMDRFHLRNGETVQGRVTFESGEVVLVQTGVGGTIRLEQAGVASQEPSDVSFMPGGLLARATPQELADLYAWLKSLGK